MGRRSSIFNRRGDEFGPFSEMLVGLILRSEYLVCGFSESVESLPYSLRLLGNGLGDQPCVEFLSHDCTDATW